MKCLAFIVFIFSQVIASGQSLSKEIDSIYNFRPRDLSEKEQKSKIPSLDKFWNKIKNDTSAYLPQLRYELIQTGHNPYFYFDGSSLLLSLSAAKTDKETAVLGISKCDLADISRQPYVATLNQLAREGINVTTAAVKILNEDKFSFFIPQHAMTFNQGYCLAYMLLPQKDNRYADTLISLFPTVSATAKRSIITTLWFAYSCKGDTFLQSVINNPALEKEVREYAKKIMGNTKLSKDQKEYIELIGKEHVNEIRETSLQRFSDEAIAELDMTTRIMRREERCR